jgi:hypothetical protein
VTDTEETTGDPYHEAHLPIARDFVDRVGAAMLSGGDRGLMQVDVMVAALDAEQLEDLLVGLSARTKIDTLLAGRVAYEIRKQTPDGEWGQEVRKLAMACEVSDRTIHRWMSAAQEHFGFELTAAQKNAEARPTPVGKDAGPGHEGSLEDWADIIMGDEYDDEEETAAAGFGESTTDGLDGQIAMRESVGEPWTERDSVIPPVTYENEVSDRTARPAGRAVIPPDETWLAFTEAQIVSEHPALGPSGGAAKSAKARWDRMTETEPLELLEQLEMIHEHDEVPDELVQALFAAEETKAIKPEVVEKPKRRGGGAGSAKTPEGLLTSVRDLHQQIVKTKDEGGAQAVADRYGKDVATLQSMIHTAQGCLTKVRAAAEEAGRLSKAAEAAGPPAF